MSDWLERLRGLVRTHDRAPETEQSRRVKAALGERAVFASEAGWLDAVAAAIGDGEVDPRTVEQLVGVLKVPGFYGELAEEEAVAHLRFWQNLAARHPGDAVLVAHFADVELTLGDSDEGARRIVEAFDRQPELFLEFGLDLEDDVREVGGVTLFHWQLHLLRWYVRAPVDPADSGEAARELYGELLEEYGDDPARLAALHPLGEEIRRLEVAGDLPRAMVVRRRRKPRHDAEG